MGGLGGNVNQTHTPLPEWVLYSWEAESLMPNVKTEN